MKTLEQQQAEAREEFIEAGASIEHERWADWQKYMHSKILPSSDDGISVIGTDFVDRWNRQIVTPYSELSEEEKEKDREQVRRYSELLDTLIARIVRETREAVLEECENKITELTPPTNWSVGERGAYKLGTCAAIDVITSLKERV